MSLSKQYQFYFHSEDENSRNLESLHIPAQLEDKMEFFNVKNMDKRNLESHVDGVPLICDTRSYTLHKGEQSIRNFVGAMSHESLTSISLRDTGKNKQSWLQRYMYHPLPQQDYDTEVTVSKSDNLHANVQGRHKISRKSSSEIKKAAEGIFNKKI